MWHTVKRMAPQFVKPYIKANKNNANDAADVCEALSRKCMCLVFIKNTKQQDLQSLHRICRQVVKQRIAQAKKRSPYLNHSDKPSVE